MMQWNFSNLGRSFGVNEIDGGGQKYSAVARCHRNKYNNYLINNKATKTQRNLVKVPTYLVVGDSNNHIQEIEL